MRHSGNTRAVPVATGAASLRPSARVEAALIALFWLFFALLTAADRILDPRGQGFLAGVASPALAIPLAESAVWALLTPLVFAASTRMSAERVQWPARVALLALFGLVTAVFVDVASDIIRADVFDIGRRRPIELLPLRSVTNFWFLDDLIVFAAVLAAGFARSYFFRYRARQEEAARLQAEATQLQAQAARLHAQLSEARLAALRTQINPHFLFNTLHAISTLVERDPRGVRRMIARLSELLRHTLEADEQEVPLARELGFLERYFEIMRIRFQGRLEVDVQTEPGTLTALVPNLILQPLVENAMKHGVSKITDMGRIELRAHVQDGRLVVSVRDNGPPVAEDDAAAAEEGVGLSNTRERLVQLYGAEQSLTLDHPPSGGTVAEISLPFHTAADLHAAELLSRD